MSAPGDPALAARLRREIAGEVLFDRLSRGLYSTDASIYQIEPIGVVVPRTDADVRAAIAIAAEAGVPVLARGAGTSQGGQAVGAALILDFTKHLDRLVELDADARTATVEPGIVLDRLNARLEPHGLFFPIDPSTASRATIGGMAGNNSCGARSIRYGNMVHNVRAIDAVLADGTEAHLAEVPGDIAALPPGRYRDLVTRLRAVAAREQGEIASRFPKLLRRVGGYNLDGIDPAGHNMAHMLVGSEGTLAVFRRLTLALQPLPAHRVLGIAHFPTLHAAMAATKPIVALDPDAVELVDRTMIDLARAIPAYRPTIERTIRGAPEAILLIEFAGEEAAGLGRRLDELAELLGALPDAGPLVEASDPAVVAEVWEVRKAGLNIMMSMKGEGKPVSFIEDCAVSLDDLPEYTQRLNEVFARHGTQATWYAHASVGCLHVRPILDMKDETDVRKMRAIAEEAFAMVRAYKGSHSGEHGDGLVRSEFHEAMFGPRVVRAFEEVKAAFDPAGLLNPGKIVRPPRMDDRSLFRYRPGYAARLPDTALDWSAWGGFAGAVEMCNNNGACRKAGGVMCPSFQATRDEMHLTRGRANALRLAISGQLGAEALTSEALFDTLDLCIGCKGCRRECPTGVDMTRMKTEFLHHYRERHGVPLRARLFAHLPAYAPWAARLGPLLGLRDRVPGLAALSQSLVGLTARRPLPRWRGNGVQWRARGEAGNADAVLFVDTFNRYFEPENVGAALVVLEAGGYRIAIAGAPGARPLCCGRTYMAAGLVARARAEARRTLAALRPFVAREVPLIGLEPACLFTLRDEFTALLPGPDTDKLAARALLFEEFLAAEAESGRLDLRLKPLAEPKALVHGHCHQKAFGAMGAVTRTLGLVPDLEVEVIEAGCCGMAGAFGYEREHYELSLRIGELGPLPAVRAASPECLIVADGVSCRQQIAHATPRTAHHAARVLEAALA